MVNLHWSVLASALAIGLLLPSIGAAPQATAGVVEGHTTYVELTADAAPEYTIIGDISCHYEIRRIRVDVPPSVASAFVECVSETYVYAHEEGAPDPREHALTPTGRWAEVLGPNEGVWTVTEYAYTAVDPATGEAATHHAWVVPAQDPQAHPDTGKRYSFVVAVDPHRLSEGAEVRLATGDAPPGAR